MTFSIIMFQTVSLFLRSKISVAFAPSKHVKSRCQHILSACRNTSAATSVEGLLIDITGVLYESGTKHAIQGSVEAIEKLRSCKIPFRFVTNESMSTRIALAKKLQSFGFNISEEEIFSPGVATSLYIKENKLRPFLLVHPDILSEFADCDQSSPNCVVVGDAGEHFTYHNMNKAFSVLMKTENPQLITMGKGKYYKDKDELVMDLGGFTAALEYATGVNATIIGKPYDGYFYDAVKSLHLRPEDTAMVGDDMYSDICAAQKCSIKGVIVRTGKFRQQDIESRFVRPDAIVDNLAHFVDMLCSAKGK